MSTESAEASIDVAGDDKAVRYWEKRKSSMYLFAAYCICAKFCSSPASVIDVGSHRTPILEWFRGTASRLVSLDLRRPYVASGVESVTCDFLKYVADQRFDLATCFQVLEHVRKPQMFAPKLLDVARVIVVSVPYKWPEGKCKYHVQDPVDRSKMLAWFGRKPIFSYVARELTGTKRLICVYRGE